MDSRLQEISIELIKMSEKAYRISEEIAQTNSLHQGYHPKMEAIHKENAERLEKIIFEIGWPTIEKVGEEASYSAWLILQHAITNPNLQRTSLPLLQDLVDKNQIMPQEVARLYDRICFFELRPQKYGTQFDFDENNILSPWTIEDLEHVDQYREEVGLPPLAMTIKKMREMSVHMKDRPKEDYKQRLKKRVKWSKDNGWLK